MFFYFLAKIVSYDRVIFASLLVILPSYQHLVSRPKVLIVRTSQPTVMRRVTMAA